MTWHSLRSINNVANKGFSSSCLSLGPVKSEQIKLTPTHLMRTIDQSAHSERLTSPDIKEEETDILINNFIIIDTSPLTVLSSEEEDSFLCTA